MTFSLWIEDIAGFSKDPLLADQLRGINKEYLNNKTNPNNRYYEAEELFK